MFFRSIAVFYTAFALLAADRFLGSPLFYLLRPLLVAWAGVFLILSRFFPRLPF